MAERDSGGRFVKGQSGNPKGRATKPVEEKYRKALVGRVTLADWREIVDKAKAQAKRGDPRARQWLSDHLIGPATQRTEHSGVGGGPIPFEFTIGGSRDDEA
jgi:hypothetical protein